MKMVDQGGGLTNVSLQIEDGDSGGCFIWWSMCFLQIPLFAHYLGVKVFPVCLCLLIILYSCRMCIYIHARWRCLYIHSAPGDVFISIKFGIFSVSCWFCVHCFFIQTSLSLDPFLFIFSALFFVWKEKYKFFVPYL